MTRQIEYLRGYKNKKTNQYRNRQRGCYLYQDPKYVKFYHLIIFLRKRQQSFTLNLLSLFVDSFCYASAHFDFLLGC